MCVLLNWLNMCLLLLVGQPGHNQRRQYDVSVVYTTARPRVCGLSVYLSPMCVLLGKSSMCCENRLSLPVIFSVTPTHSWTFSGHRETGMVDIVSRRCRDPSCGRRPLYNMDGLRPVCCSQHKAPGMIDVVSTRCQEPVRDFGVRWMIMRHFAVPLPFRHARHASVVRSCVLACFIRRFSASMLSLRSLTLTIAKMGCLAD